MIHLLLGFLIALAVGLTGIGGGSFTVPALLLIFGLPAGEAVGTAFVFAGVLRLIAAPFYLLGRHVHSRYFRLLLIGAVPGLVLGMLALTSCLKQATIRLSSLSWAYCWLSPPALLLYRRPRIQGLLTKTRTGCLGWRFPSELNRDFPLPEPAHSARFSSSTIRKWPQRRLWVRTSFSDWSWPSLEAPCIGRSVPSVLQFCCSCWVAAFPESSLAACLPAKFPPKN